MSSKASIWPDCLPFWLVFNRFCQFWGFCRGWVGVSRISLYSGDLWVLYSSEKNYDCLWTPLSGILLPLTSSNVFAIPNWMSIDIIRPHRVTKCPQKPQSDPTVCHFDWVLTIFINFEGVARDWWGFQGYRYTQGTFWCNIQAKKITTVFGPPFRVFYYLWPPQMYLPSLIEWVLI